MNIYLLLNIKFTNTSWRWSFQALRIKRQAATHYWNAKMAIIFKQCQIEHMFIWTFFIIFVFPIHSWSACHMLGNILYIHTWGYMVIVRRAWIDLYFRTRRWHRDERNNVYARRWNRRWEAAAPPFIRLWQFHYGIEANGKQNGRSWRTRVSVCVVGPSRYLLLFFFVIVLLSLAHSATIRGCLCRDCELKS